MSHSFFGQVYVGIFLTLMVLTAVTVLVAYVNLGQWNKVVALGIATFKATLVILYFMHVKYSSRLTKLVVVSRILLPGDPAGLTMVDYGSREWVNPPAYGLRKQTREAAPAPGAGSQHR